MISPNNETIKVDDDIERRNALNIAQSIFGVNSEGDLAKRFGPGTVGQHELWDRLHVFQCTWHDHVASHPAMALDAEAFAASRRVGELIGEIYQRMGRGPHIVNAPHEE